MNSDKLVMSFGWVYRTLVILFVALKLEGIIDWSWLWVISPILIQAGILTVSYIILGIIWILQQLK